jgi:hypothetical protein
VYGANPSTKDDVEFLARLSDGKVQGFMDAKKAIDNYQCVPEHSNL